MAKVIITIEDKDNDEIKIGFEFDPPAKEGEVKTPAQSMGIAVAKGFSMELEAS